MKLICKDTNKGSITFFTKGKYAFRGVDRNDTTDDVPDPILDVNNYNESIQFYSKTPGIPEGEYLCDSMGLDRNVIVEYFNKIGNG